MLHLQHFIIIIIEELFVRVRVTLFATHAVSGFNSWQ